MSNQPVPPHADRRTVAQGRHVTPNGWQIRTAREMLGLSQEALGKAARVGFAVVVHAELLDRTPSIPGSVAAIWAALEARGIAFVPDPDGVGVELR